MVLIRGLHCYKNNSQFFSTFWTDRKTRGNVADVQTTRRTMQPDKLIHTRVKRTTQINNQFAYGLPNQIIIQKIIFKNYQANFKPDWLQVPVPCWARSWVPQSSWLLRWLPRGSHSWRVRPGCPRSPGPRSPQTRRWGSPAGSRGSPSSPGSAQP